MKRVAQTYYLIWLCVGILIATIAANRLFASDLINYLVLYQWLSGGWEKQMESPNSVILWVLLIRLSETALIALVCQRARYYHKQMGVYLMVCYFGVAIGLTIVLFTWCLGIKGILACLFVSFPHELFYCFVWGIMILRTELAGEHTNGRFYLLCMLLMAVGIIMEIWINPIFLSLV